MPDGGRNKVQAWDTDSHSEDSDLLTYDEDLDDVGRSKLLHGACQLVLAGQAVALALFAGHTDGAEHAVFYVCDAFVVLLFLVYSVLRCLGHLGPASMAPVCAGFTWALSLLLSLGAPGRRRRLLGLEESGSADHCEEGSAALWIALLLSLCPVLVQMPSVPFFLLGQLVSVQHLIIGLILPRPECSRDAGGPGGATLGLPPIWVSSLQLSLLAALLVGGHWHLERRRQAERVIARFLDTRSSHRRDEVASSPSLAQNRLERIVNELEKEEKDCRRLVRELDDVMPPSYSSDRVWASLPLHVAGLLKHCSGQLKRHTVDGDNATDQLFRAMERGQERGETAVVSGWLEQTWGGPQGHTRQRRSSIARSEHVNLAAVDEEDGGGRLERSTTIVGLAVEWRIGEWEFDALKCEQDHRHVLQTVGFELLRGYSILPREPLGAFLELLERAYMAGNPYHSHVHGADMTNALFYLINKTELWDLAEIADSTRAATIVAALGHDVGHFARNNTFLISSRHALAVTYNDRSILENYHSATLMKLLDTAVGESEEKRTKLFSGFPADHLQKARNLMITLILGTDPAKHLDDLSAFRLRLGSTSFDPASDDADQQTCLSMLFRAADIGHSAKDWHLHQEWSRRVVQEFHAQGDQEKSMGLKVSPLCEREGFQLPSSQVGFLQFICLPTWTELANLEGRIKEMGQMVFPSRHSARKSTISSNGKKSPTCASPRENAPTAPNLQRRGSIGHAIGMLTGGARSSPFLALPGAMPPGTPNNKVVPAVPEELVPAQNRCVRDVCLGNCDRNCQQWKAMAKTSMTTESFPNISTFDAERTALSTPEPEAQVEGPSPRGDEEGAP